MKRILLLAGLCLIVVFAIVAGLLRQLAPGLGDSGIYAWSLAAAVSFAVLLSIIVAQDGETNR